MELPGVQAGSFEQCVPPLRLGSPGEGLVTVPSLVLVGERGEVLRLAGRPSHGLVRGDIRSSFASTPSSTSVVLWGSTIPSWEVYGSGS